MAGQLPICRGETRIDSGNGSSVRFVCAGLIHIAALVRKGDYRSGYFCKLVRDRQLSAPAMPLSQVVREKCLRRASESQAQRVRRNMWVPIAVAANPATGPQETCR